MAPSELPYKEIPKLLFRHRDITTNMQLEDIIELIYPEEKTPAKKKVAIAILTELRKNLRAGMTKKDLAKFQKNTKSLSKATFYRVLADLKRLGFVRYEDYAYTYYLSNDFATALERLAKAYRKWIESALQQS
ncbi:MAG: hypothetical protein ACP6IU_08020 [Candidatus Asgardarchaeia archaeon]